MTPYGLSIGFRTQTLSWLCKFPAANSAAGFEQAACILCNLALLIPTMKRLKNLIGHVLPGNRAVICRHPTDARCGLAGLFWAPILPQAIIQSDCLHRPGTDYVLFRQPTNGSIPPQRLHLSVRIKGARRLPATFRHILSTVRPQTRVIAACNISQIISENRRASCRI